MQGAIPQSGYSVFREVHDRVTSPSEGGVSHDPHDKGGLTAYGVSLAFLKSLGAEKPGFVEALGLSLPVTEKTVLEVSPETARKIFYREFWLAPGLDCLLSPLACDCYDIGVNMGARQGVRMLQAALNEITGAGLAADGIAGPLTCAAQTGLTQANARLVHETIIRLQKQRYENIAARNPSQKKFLKGWLKRSERLDRFVRGRYF